MKAVFADMAYWIALIWLEDPWARLVHRINQDLANTPIITTQEVLTEVLDSFAAKGPYLRNLAVAAVRRIMRSPQVHVRAQSDVSYLNGLSLYEKREDKGYSLVDGISMNTMRSEGILEVLTTDRDFEQEGFVALLRARA